ncbi:hypothetical protein BC833DRAFT_573285 [Globomyces pollinis-pini]|nr:hypothetical protein BC833DRAFT_573285 [Globomyces pollinis-pini]
MSNKSKKLLPQMSYPGVAPPAVEWLLLAEKVVGSDLDTMPMIVFLVKRYYKKKIEYEEMVNAIEELIPHQELLLSLKSLKNSAASFELNTHVLLSKDLPKPIKTWPLKGDLRFVKQTTPCLSPQITPITPSNAKPPPILTDLTQRSVNLVLTPPRDQLSLSPNLDLHSSDGFISDFFDDDSHPCNENTKLVHLSSSIDRSNSKVSEKYLASATQSKLQPTEKVTLRTDIPFDQSHQGLKTEEMEITHPSEQSTGSLFHSNSRFEYSNDVDMNSIDDQKMDRKIVSTEESANNPIQAQVEYIISSLSRHSDAIGTLLDDEEENPVPAFQYIIEKMNEKQYNTFEALETDIFNLFQELENQDSQMGRIKKHFTFLIEYYSPTIGRGKLRNKPTPIKVQAPFVNNRKSTRLTGQLAPSDSLSPNVNQNHMAYIINSISRHSDALDILFDGTDSPIPIFKTILFKSESLLYDTIDQFNKDMEAMFAHLENLGRDLGRMKKLYSGLVEFYFPIHGALRSRRKSRCFDAIELKVVDKAALVVDEEKLVGEINDHSKHVADDDTREEKADVKDVVVENGSSASVDLESVLMSDNMMPHDTASVDTKSTSNEEYGQDSIGRKPLASSPLQYIVQSLARHSDSLESLFNDDDVPIDEFQNILTKSEEGEYLRLECLQKDLECLFSILERRGVRMDRVRKHYIFLVEFYFPSQGRSRLRNNRNNAYTLQLDPFDYQLLEAGVSKCVESSMESELQSQLEYIVMSLTRHSDCIETLYEEDEETRIPAFQNIFRMIEKNGYKSLDTFNNDIEQMFKDLEATGNQMDRVRKHYIFLVEHYFPSRGRGRLRKKASNSTLAVSSPSVEETQSQSSTRSSKRGSTESKEQIPAPNKKPRYSLDQLESSNSTIEHLNYIVSSLSRHSDSREVLYKRNGTPIVAFQKILKQSESNGYTTIQDLKTDLEKLFTKLENSGIQLIRIRKLFTNLMEYYFPSLNARGRLRNTRKSLQ